MSRTLRILAMVLLTLAACGRSEEGHPRAAQPITVRGVRVEALRAETVPETVEAVGTVRSRVTSVLSARVVGSVVAVRVREGDRVRPGQLLVEIDARETRTQTEQARAGLREAEAALDEVGDGIRAAEQGVAAAEANSALAESTFGRFQELWSRKSVSRQEYEEAEARRKGAEAEARRAEDLLSALKAKRAQVRARMEQAQAQVSRAQIAAGYASVTAPIAGIVAQKPVEVGSLAAPGLPLLTLEDSRYRLEASVEESSLGKIRSGQRVPVRIDALPDRNLEGVVAEIAPAGDPATRSYLVKLDLPAAPGLRSGLFGRARFPTGERPVLRIPANALIERGQLTGVFVVDDARTARLRLVTAGVPEAGRVEVLSGLSAGERVAVEGADRLQDGARVE